MTYRFRFTQDGQAPVIVLMVSRCVRRARRLAQAELDARIARGDIPRGLWAVAFVTTQ